MLYSMRFMYSTYQKELFNNNIFKHYENYRF